MQRLSLYGSAQNYLDYWSMLISKLISNTTRFKVLFSTLLNKVCSKLSAYILRRLESEST